MRFKVKGHGELEIEGLTPMGLPALKIVRENSPDMTVNCHNGVGFLRVRLGDIELSAPIRDEPVNVDRAQLAKLGGS